MNRIFDKDLPCRTRNGAEVIILTTKARGDYPIVGHIGDSIELVSWTAEGKYVINSNILEYLKDLVNIPRVIKGYMNVYSSYNSPLYACRVGADFATGADRVACIYVEYEEGQYDA
jgi:hypothetical protein